MNFLKYILQLGNPFYFKVQYTFTANAIEIYVAYLLHIPYNYKFVISNFSKTIQIRTNIIHNQISTVMYLLPAIVSITQNL